MTLNIGPLSINDTIPVLATIDRSKFTMQQMISVEENPDTAITLIPAADLFTFYIKRYLYPACEDYFIFTDADNSIIQIMPDLNQLLVSEPMTVMELQIDADFYFALLVNDIKTKFSEVADRMFNQELSFPGVYGNLDHVETDMEWVCNLIDRADLESLIRAAVLDPSLADVLIVKYNKYRNFFNSGDDFDTLTES